MVNTLGVIASVCNGQIYLFDAESSQLLHHLPTGYFPDRGNGDAFARYSDQPHELQHRPIRPNFQ